MTKNKRIETAEQETEKLLVSQILNHIGHLLIAKSPIKSKAAEDADKYRAKLMDSLTSEQRVPFIQTRAIIYDMMELMAKCQDRARLSKVMEYFRMLNKGEVYLVDSSKNGEVKQRLKEYFIGFQAKKVKCRYSDSELDDIIKIVQNIESQAEFEAAQD